MVILEAIKERASVRDYLPEEVTRGQVDALIMAALESPSARNRQPWRFVVVEDKAVIAEMEADAIAYMLKTGDAEMKKHLAGADTFLFYHAPLVIFITSDGSEWANIDCGIAAENIAIAAKGLGLGTVIVGLARALFEGYGDKWVKRLGFEEGYGFTLSVAVGHAKGVFTPHEPDPTKVSYIRATHQQ